MDQSVESHHPTNYFLLYVELYKRGIVELYKWGIVEYTCGHAQFEITVSDQFTNMSIGTNGVDLTVLDMCVNARFS